MTVAHSISSVETWPLDLPMKEPFEIAGGTQSRVANVIVRVRLRDGAAGWGECAPLSIFDGQTQASTLACVRRAAPALRGADASRWTATARRLERLGVPPAARAGVEMAALDAWLGRRRLPLWSFFGGAGSKVATDVTIPIVSAPRAAEAARRLWTAGIRTLKIKVGKDIEEDLARTLAATAAAPRAALILDANQGYSPAQALRLAARLRRRGVRPVLFEQPVAKDDVDGLAQVARGCGIPVAADESASDTAAVWHLARRRAASVVNIKLMKSGIAGAVEIARTARAAGLGLMMGGNIESPLSMTCAAHLAAGFGGFSFVDLDTPLWFSSDPTVGVRMDRRGIYDLSGVRAGIGVRLKSHARPKSH